MVGSSAPLKASPSGAVAESPLEAALQARARALGFELDDAQRSILPYFARIEADLQRAASRGRGWWSLFRKSVQPRGLYLWGGVGRGKSFMMDGFFEEIGRAHV